MSDIDTPYLPVIFELILEKFGRLNTFLCMMYDTDRTVSYTFELIVVFICVCVCVCVLGEGGLNFRMVLCVGCLCGTVLYVCIEYHI